MVPKGAPVRRTLVRPVQKDKTEDWAFFLQHYSKGFRDWKRDGTRRLLDPEEDLRVTERPWRMSDSAREVHVVRVWKTGEARDREETNRRKVTRSTLTRRVILDLLT